jgi:hypothetical protein
MTVEELLMIFRTEPHTTKRRVLVAELHRVKRGIRLRTPPDGVVSRIVFEFDTGKYRTVEEFIESLHLVERSTTLHLLDNRTWYDVADIKVENQQYYNLILQRNETRNDT